ncbi:hypothetical protein F4802DRAFT_600097 [Xylaria palmicola]|nr:hypothetical protein F4802DRAFT_600097 [Xylaria palmicola]
MDFIRRVVFYTSHYGWPDEGKEGFEYVYIQGTVNYLMSTAVRYADGPLRPYLKEDPMFAKFCDKVESFEALFKADDSVASFSSPSFGIPTFVTEYLDQRLREDLQWLHLEFRKSEKRALEGARKVDSLADRDLEVGIVLSLVVHLLQLIPLYGPRDDDVKRVEYRSSDLVTKSIGGQPQFVWLRKSEDKALFFGVSHRDPGAMDRCWRNSNNGQSSREDADQTIDFDDNPENCLCLLDGKDAFSSVLKPNAATDPAAHEGCLKMTKSKIWSSHALAHSELYKLQESRNSKLAKRWRALLKKYESKSRQSS